MSRFDASAAAAPGSGLFGLQSNAAASAIVIVPVPFAATVSYGGGAENGPAAILAASRQVDLFDLQTGRPYERGICLLDADPRLRVANDSVRPLAAAIIARGGAAADDRDVIERIDAAGALVNESVHDAAQALLSQGKICGVLGGDHSVPYGAIRAAAAHQPGLGILHVDAHADLRRAYEGFRWSHASIMDNVLRDIAGVQRIVQVGIRDFAEAEFAAIQASEGRVIAHFDLELRRRLGLGETWARLCDEIVAALPASVWVSFDIDGLDPALCPNTGTPVPGGLGFSEACLLLAAVVGSGRRIVGFDLVEVAPGANEWDANVGARVLYKLCGFAALSRR
jgi:agmatinase